jgi:hypothetical protein
MNSNKDSKTSTPTQNNHNEIENNNNSEDSFVELLNSIPINNLNDYYDIETSAFKKRCDKLNLKFYWETESLANQKEIPHPYNKLFIILFKEISLYIEEIERLNKQLRQKNKNEKYYQERIFEYSQKEKDNALVKQMLKNSERTNKLLEKKEQKLKLELEKLQQKLSNANNNSLYNNSIINNVNKTRNSSRFSRGDNKRISHSIDMKNNNLFTGRRKNQSRENTLRLSTTNNDNNLNLEAIDLGIEQCDNEIDNLNILEEMLEKQKNKTSNNLNKKKNLNLLKKI